MTANEAYVSLIEKVLDRGFEYLDPNREGVKRKQIPHGYITVPVGGAPFPAITLRKVSPKTAFAEFSAFFTGASTLHALEKAGCKFWRKDAHRYYKKVTGYPHYPFEAFEADLPDVDMGMIYPKQMYSFGVTNDSPGVNQVQGVLDEITRHTFGTKRTVTMWNPLDRDRMALTPCHWSFELLTYKDSDGETCLDLVWHQHSVDLFLGLPYNIMYYAYALIYFSAYLGFKSGSIHGSLTNIHLYDNQWEAADLILSRYDGGQGFYGGDFRWSKGVQMSMDFQTFVKENRGSVVNYSSLPAIKGVEMLTYSK